MSRRFTIELTHGTRGWLVSVYQPAQTHDGRPALASVAGFRAPTMLGACARLAGSLRKAGA